MRPFETVLFFANLSMFATFTVPRLRALRWARHFALFALLILSAQALIEGPRWQIFPAYVLSALFSLALLLPDRKRREDIGDVRLQRLAAGLSTALVASTLAISAALPMAFPVFQFPPPNGPYGIGTLIYHWVDTSRLDIFTEAPGAHRELMVQVWYPAEKRQNGTRAPYVQPGTNFEALARLVHLPAFFFDHLKYVTTNAQPAAPMVGGPASFPLLIFATGRGGFRQSSTFEVEELVSHGYVVAGIDQPYTAADVVFPDGRHVELDKRVADSVLDERVVDDTFMLRVFDFLGQDTMFTLNQLSTLNKTDPNRILAGRLDLQHVGIFGTSLGGITTAEGCRLNRRFRACLILDVAMPPDVVQSGLQQPTMWISADAKDKRREGWTMSDINEQQTTVQAVFSSLSADGYQVLIPGMFHADISDFPSFIAPPLGTWLGVVGPADSRRTHAIINAYSLAFFDRYLKGQSAALLAVPEEPYPEVLLETRRH